jgi:hypothetical protein
LIVIHFILGILYIGIPLFLVLYYRTYYLENLEDKRIFTLGFILKMLGATSAVLIYIFYYRGGDTTDYFDSGKFLLEYVSENIDQLPTILFSSDLKNYQELAFIQFGKKANYWYSKPTYTVTKISLLFNFITVNSFYLTSILCSYFSFFCSWKLYRFILNHTSLNRTQVGYAIFLMPSVIFWGSGLFKDTFTLAGLYLLIIGFVQFFGYNKFKLYNILYMIIGVYLLYSIRSFFLMAALPFLIIWVISLKFYAIPSFTVKFFLTPIFIGLISLSGFMMLKTISETFQELSFEKLVDKSKGFQSWHTTLQGSAYSLGDIDYTSSALVSKIPASLTVTFFRPFLWEAGKPIILLSALQSLFFLLTTIYLILKMRVIYFFSSFFKSPQAIALMGFSLFYGMVVGFTSYNFGALDRYKIPCLSTYMLALLFILDKYNHINKAEK